MIWIDCRQALPVDLTLLSSESNRVFASFSRLMRSAANCAVGHADDICRTTPLPSYNVLEASVTIWKDSPAEGVK
jgi:hypothetical protein